MSFTYTGELDTPLERVRHLTADTNHADPLLSDAEVSYHLTEQNGDERAAAADACEVIATKLARELDRSAIGLSQSPGRSAEFYMRRAEKLREEGQTLAQVFVGGLTLSGKEALAADSDAVQPQFALGMDDFDGQGGDPTGQA